MSTKILLKKINDLNLTHSKFIPVKHEIEQLSDLIINFLFPVRAQFHQPEPTSVIQFDILKKKVFQLLQPVVETGGISTSSITVDFFTHLSSVFDLLTLDAKAILQYDPAAKSLEEIITAYPGFYAVALHRLAHILYKMQLPFIPRVIAEYAHSKTGIDIHPGALIGESFFIDHGTGVVIGETAIIGNNVKIYQGVTLGALQVSKSMMNKKRHPTVEDNVTIYSGSTILGGNTTIGHDTVIGGNVWLTNSVPSFSIVYATHQVKVRNSREYQEAIDFVI